MTSSLVKWLEAVCTVATDEAAVAAWAKTDTARTPDAANPKYLTSFMMPTLLLFDFAAGRMWTSAWKIPLKL